YVAAELSKHGADKRSIRVLDTQGIRGEELVGIEGSEIVWNGDGFFYAFTPVHAAHATRWSESRIRFHRLGHEQADDRDVVPPSNDKDATSGMNPLGLTDDGRFLLVRTFGSWTTQRYAVVDLGGKEWKIHDVVTSSGVVTGSNVFKNSIV